MSRRLYPRGVYEMRKTAFQPKRNARRERRIAMDILVETYNAEDDAMAWYN